MCNDSAGEEAAPDLLQGVGRGIGVVCDGTLDPDLDVLGAGGERLEVRFELHRVEALAHELDRLVVGWTHDSVQT